MCDRYGIDYDTFWNRLFDEFEKHNPHPGEMVENTLLRLEMVHDCRVSVLSPVFGFTKFWWDIPTLFELPLDSIHYGSRDVMVSSSLSEISGACNSVPNRFAVLRDSPYTMQNKHKLSSMYRGSGATAVLPDLSYLEDQLWHQAATDVNPATK